MKKCFTLLAAVMLIGWTAAAQSVFVIDFVKIKNGREKESIFFYENNWKVYRQEALKKQFISSFQVLRTKPDSLADFDLMLITEYPDSVARHLSESRFQEIIKLLRPNGPKLLNNIEPKEFRQNMFGKEAKAVIE